MSIKVKGYNSYFGGKNGNGTFQTIINYIPPHDEFYSLYLGLCGVTRNKKPAKRNILNDIDPAIFNAWSASNLPPGFELHNRSALEMLRSVIADKRDVISSPKPFIYLDPPYKFDSRRNQTPVYKFKMSDNDHIDLLTLISAMLEFNIMVSHYDDPVYNEILAGWNTHEFYSMTRQGLALEKIYYNYTLTDELHDYSYIGADFREREANNRIKRNFLKKLKRLPARLRNSILQDLIAQ